ncbi:DUF3958 family protein [Carnobacterium gallinarum]|uniref:DUF3958 family protein n=1 Tax=Carnobacterium gallinarum TaxID=2749 RepID=UPI000556413B|nr:DUF3958 family protein [Carnobacterium gallinarum]
MTKQTFEEVNYRLRNALEQQEESERMYQKYEQKSEEAHSIFSEVVQGFHEDQAIWQHGEMYQRTESLLEEAVTTQQRFWQKSEDSQEELAQEKQSLVQKVVQLEWERQQLVVKEKLHGD